jgi:hypothetical protein
VAGQTHRLAAETAQSVEAVSDKFRPAMRAGFKKRVSKI